MKRDYTARSPSSANVDWRKMLHMIPEYLVCDLCPDEDEPQHPELEAGDTQVDGSDPRLTVELQWCDPEADAYERYPALKIMMDNRGEPASVEVRWH